jgi:hypothetical protein
VKRLGREKRIWNEKNGFMQGAIFDLYLICAWTIIEPS